jgi:hypothetical protein
MNIFGYILKGLKAVFRIFTSPAAQRAMQTIARISEVALPIVVDLASKYSPSGSKVEDVLDAYKQYGVPVLSTYTQSKESIGNALLNLGTELLRRKLSGKDATLSTDILNSAIQIAVSAAKAK